MKFQRESEILAETRVTDHIDMSFMENDEQRHFLLISTQIDYVVYLTG